MTRHNISNPFTAQSPIGASIVNLGNAIFGARLSPSEQEKQRLETELLRQRTDTLSATAENTRGDTAFETQQRGDIARIAELLGGAERRLETSVAPDVRRFGPFQPEREAEIAAQQTTLDKAALPLRLGQAGASQISNPQDLANLFNFVQANTPSTNDAEKFAAIVGRGDTPGVNEAVSIGDREAIRNMNALLARQKDAADRRPLSRTEFEAGVLAEQTPEFNADRLQSTGIPTVSVLDPDDRPVRVPRTVVGMEAGSEQDALLRDAPGAVAPGATSTDALRPTKPVLNAVQTSKLAMDDFKIVMDTVVGIAKKDATLFGVAGQVRRAQQLVSGQIDALSQIFNADRFEDISVELSAAGVQPDFFDPNLKDLDKLATLVAYQAASALAQQTGRGLSDRDFAVFRELVGNPDSFFSEQNIFLSGMRRLQQVADRMMKARHKILQGNRINASGSGDNTGTEPDIIFELDANGNLVRTK